MHVYMKVHIWTYCLPLLNYKFYGIYEKYNYIHIYSSMYHFFSKRKYAKVLDYFELFKYPKSEISKCNDGRIYNKFYRYIFSKLFFPLP